MTTSVYLITHGNVGQAIESAVASTLGTLPISTKSISVTYEVDPENLLNQINNELDTEHPQDDILILTDLYGSTPSNIASQLRQRKHTCVVAGLNIPMLLRVMNYAHLSLPELAEKAYSGGQDGIVNITDKGNH